MEQENNTNPTNSTFDKEYAEIVINRLEAQRNDAYNRVALLEAELIKAKAFIENSTKEKKE